MKKRIIIISLIFIIIMGLIAIIILKPKEKENKTLELEQINIIEYEKEFNMEIGETLPTINDYIKKINLKDSDITYKIDGKEIPVEELNIGTYKVFIGDKEISTLNILDTAPPKLTLKELTIKENEKYDINSFISSCTDNSKDTCILSFKDESMGSYTKAGTYDIQIIAKDNSKNAIILSTKLIIQDEKTINNPPVETKPKPTTNANEEITYKYGTKIIKKINSDKSVSYSYDYSTFNAKTDDMKSEAYDLVINNNNIYKQILKETNNYRDKVGAKALVLDTNLSIAATIRAIEMAYSNIFSHDRPNGSSCFTVIDELGLSYSMNGENIYYESGFMTSNPNNATVAWRNSSGHYKNMIEKNYTKLGVGYYKLDDSEYYVQLFGS